MADAPSRPHIHVALDFDSTLTTSDTLAELASIPYATFKGKDLPPFADLVEAYSKDLAAHTESFNESLPPSKRHSVHDEIKWLNSLRKVECDSEARVQKLFDGVTRRDIHKAACAKVDNGDVCFRDGWLDLYRKLVPKEVDVTGACHDVISVNWSRKWIWSCLYASVGGNAGELLRPDLRIWANELNEELERDDHASIAMGQRSDLKTSEDKAEQYRECKGFAKQAATRKHAELVSVYVGDSTTDFECLLDADVGICLRDKPMRSGQRELMDTCERLKIDLRPLSQLDISTVMHQVRHESSACIWWTESLSLVGELFEELKGSP
ncbi:MAG: hypothetical protein M1828_002681 [Chrysothrix sp. TS-e1954]|nr:MAG: hypothetical protein M1828_002681 [Chrysothrix sp. TS-e1954]